jgi:hypothetical protein
VVKAARVLLAASLALGAAGCFDVHAVDAGPLVIDDFDDGDYYPADPDFSSWTCYSFNPDSNKMYRCDHELHSDADGDGFALFLDFTITDPPNGSQEHGGASLATFTDTPVDFTRFTEIVFSNALESGNPPLSSNALFYVELGCKTAADVDGNVPGDFYVSRGVDYNSNWKTRRATLANFGPPAWINSEIEGGTVGCLTRVDSLRFTVDAQLPDGQVGHGILHVDKIFLR